MATAQGVDVFSALCESHASDIAFHVAARLLRAASGVGDLDSPAARAQVPARAPDTDPEDLLLFDDLLGIADPDVGASRGTRHQVEPLTASVAARSIGRPCGGTSAIDAARCGTSSRTRATMP
jgi:hypothetical protein